MDDIIAEDYLTLCVITLKGAHIIKDYLQPLSFDDSYVEKNEEQQHMADVYGDEGIEYYEVHLNTIKYCFELMSPFDELLDEWVEEL